MHVTFTHDLVTGELKAKDSMIEEQKKKIEEIKQNFAKSLRQKAQKLAEDYQEKVTAANQKIEELQQWRKTLESLQRAEAAPASQNLRSNACGSEVFECCMKVICAIALHHRSDL